MASDNEAADFRTVQVPGSKLCHRLLFSVVLCWFLFVVLLEKRPLKDRHFRALLRQIKKAFRNVHKLHCLSLLDFVRLNLTARIICGPGIRFGILEKSKIEKFHPGI